MARKPRRGVSLLQAVRGKPPKPKRIRPTQQRRAAKLAAEEKYPILKDMIEKIRTRLNQNYATGRFGYRATLVDIYELILKWELEGNLEKRKAQVSALTEVVLREDANRFSAIVRAFTGRDHRTVSRWSLLLEKAFIEEVEAEDLGAFLSSQSST
jgi:hypothetical protein